MDANILIRAVFGVRVRQILKTYEELGAFFSPEVCFEDARTYIPDICKRRGHDLDVALAILDEIARIVVTVDRALYEDYETAARERVQIRDPSDWPIVAVALLLDIPIWTEDPDFFGAGIATWTSDRVELYLRNS
ncbi:MAG: PIN domain-containing protein [Candidatus Acidiferrales bacterium]